MLTESEQIELTREMVRAALERAGLKPIPFALEIGKKRDFINDFLTDKKQKLPREVMDTIAERVGFPSWNALAASWPDLSVGEAHMASVTNAMELLSRRPGSAKSQKADEDFDSGALEDYVPVEVLPTFAGLGGGGTGDGDRRTTLLPRSLVEDDLRARAEDLLVIDLRGDSMEPDFFNGDRMVINRRDTNPVQPGPFALWDGDGYVVKNIERQRGSLRVFSSNPKYSPWTTDGSDIQIMGRPVWVARRL